MNQKGSHDEILENTNAKFFNMACLVWFIGQNLTDIVSQSRLCFFVYEMLFSSTSLDTLN